MHDGKRTQAEDVLGELVYARVLLALEREEIRRRDEELRERLDSLLTEIPEELRQDLCAEALERAWDRAAEDLRALEEAPPSDDSGDLAA